MTQQDITNKTQAVTVTYREGWTLAYWDRSGHNVRVTSPNGSTTETGCRDLIEAVKFAASVMGRIA